MNTASPYPRALAIPALGATAVTLSLFVAPKLALGAAAAVIAAGVGLAVHDARLYRRAGLGVGPAIVGGVASLLVGAVGVVFALALAARPAAAHAEQPRALVITFAPGAADAVWVLTDGQGIFAEPKGRFRWLCEDAIAPSAGVRGLWIDPAEPAHWRVATSHGLYVTRDGGCGFARVDGPVGVHRVIGLFDHPLSDDLLTGTASLDVANDVFRSHDGGATWTGAGLGLRGFVRRIVRHPLDPARVYVTHSHGLLRSDDGGVSFTPLPQGDPAVASGPDDFRLLEVDPADRDVVFAAVEGIPETIILRSTDAGARWAEVGRINDFGLLLVFDPASDEALIGGPVRPPKRSADRGRSWVATDEEPAPRCLVTGPDGRLWGCRDPYFGAPWAIAHSADLGRSWTPRLLRYEDADERWDCDPAERARRCCAGLCPGLMVPPELCGQPPPAPDLIEMCAQPAEYVLTPLDGGVDAAVADAGVPDAAPPDGGSPDTAPPLDARLSDARLPDAAPATSGDGCRAAPGGPAAPGVFILLLMLADARRRRR
ncbi:MAG: hypothetical protein H6701_12695 [Myxococcales bacterium]|nr:hypothetical protein [Myxococcales bacterium]